MDVKVHRVEILIVDHDNLGAEGVKAAIESTHYPNRCIAPKVMKTETRAVQWSDEHPLNSRDTQREAFERLFGDEVTAETIGEDIERNSP